MKKRFGQLFALFLCAVFCLFASGCGSTKLTTFTWALDELPVNLDPQTAGSESEIMAVRHLFSCLYRMDETGTPVLDAAESCLQEGTRYTFVLKSAEYHGAKGKAVNYKVTADDFVFGLQRVFMKETRSPWAEQLSGIKNSEAVLNGTASPDALGITALDEHTLQIELEEEDAEFAARLCCPGAAPCCRSFFESTGGRYGLSTADLIGNGPFTVFNRTEDGLFLRRAADGNHINNLRMVLKSGLSQKAEDGSGQFDGAALVADEKLGGAFCTALPDGVGSISCVSTTYVLVYNTTLPGLRNRNVRQALTATALSTELKDLNDGLPAGGIVPDGITLGGKSYRETVGSTIPHYEEPEALLKAGLSEEGLTKLTGIQVLIPKGSSETFGEINSLWQSELSCFFTVQEQLPREILSAVDSGNYSIALIPLTPGRNSPLSIMEEFLGSPAGSSYASAAFLKQSIRAEEQNPSSAGKAKRCAGLEREFLDHCLVTPLFCCNESLALNPALSGLAIDFFEGIPDVTYAVLN